jgi:hypothetical protein
LAGAGVFAARRLGWAFAHSPTNIRKFITALPGLGPTAKEELAGSPHPFKQRCATAGPLVAHTEDEVQVWNHDAVLHTAHLHGRGTNAKNRQRGIYQGASTGRGNPKSNPGLG